MSSGVVIQMVSNSNDNEPSYLQSRLMGACAAGI